MDIDKIENLLELFYARYKDQKKKNIFLKSIKNNKGYTWEDVYTNILKLSEELSKFISKGDRCLIISENRPEWMMADLSIMLAKGISVPAYITYTERDYEYIIDDCTPSVIFISDNTQYEKIKVISKKKNCIKKIISFENLENIDSKLIESIENILSKQKLKENKFLNLDINRKDIACIIYTSGTQGNPKGVMLSHGGILSNCKGALELLKTITTDSPIFLTWLPLSHSYEHTVQFVQIAITAKVFYAESIEKLIKNMNECKPEIMTAVPRFYQNLYQKINSSFIKIEGLKKILINETVSLGKKKLIKKRLTFFENLKNFFCEWLVRKKIKNQFGGNLKAFISGGGALDNEVGSFLNSIGLPTLQGYGLTETSPVVSCNLPNDIRVETVGPPFKQNEVKITNDGEIIVKGENVMLGYWNNQEETKKILKDGWLYTGDIGHFENNFLIITDRKKDILITPGGDNISPVKIENDLIKINFIEQALVYGDNKPYLVALLVITSEKKHISNEEIKEQIEKINKNLPKNEKIKKFFVINKQFTIENGMMTPTLKLKRYKIIKKYEQEFNKLY
jgi:long-chain acyl-CoA synthetase